MIENIEERCKEVQAKVDKINELVRIMGISHKNEFTSDKFKLSMSDTLDDFNCSLDDVLKHWGSKIKR